MPQRNSPSPIELFGIQANFDHHNLRSVQVAVRITKIFRTKLGILNVSLHTHVLGVYWILILPRWTSSSML